MNEDEEGELTEDELGQLREAVRKGLTAKEESEVLGRASTTATKRGLTHLSAILTVMKDERQAAATKSRRYARALKLLEE